MKAQLSRISFKKDKKYSGVYQQQGRMITDSDWNELMEVIKERQKNITNRTIESGVPRKGGILGNVTIDRPVSGDVTANAKIQLGEVVVDGIHAEVMHIDNSIDDFDYANQFFFQNPSALSNTGDFQYYVDVWERLVVSIQDEDLRDPALHGADTCVRTQTMAQVKHCFTGTDIYGDRNPVKGTALFDMVPAPNITPKDDPCLAQTTIATELGNYLFRLEVHYVEVDAYGSPKVVLLKWSSENGAESHLIKDKDDNELVPPIEFKSGKWYYEFFDDVTEQHLGIHLDVVDDDVKRALLRTNKFEYEYNDQYPYVRRWDGYCKLKKSGSTWRIDKAEHRGLDVSGEAGTPIPDGHLSIRLGELDLKLECKDKDFIAGDFWLALLRQSKGPLKKPEVLSNEPVGIEHHYLKLGKSHTDSQEDITSLSLDEARQLSFPPLTDITADRVGYDPRSVSSRWEDINENDTTGIPNPVTVQDAIDQMANNLEASDIKYTFLPCESTGYDAPTFKNLIQSEIVIEDGESKPKIKALWDALLCELDAAKIPYNPHIKGPRWDDINEYVSFNEDWLKYFPVGNIGSSIESPLNSLVEVDKDNNVWSVISYSTLTGYESKIIKFNEDGSATPVDLTLPVYISDFAIDNSSNIYAVGHYLDSINLGGSADALPQADFDSAFVVKIDSAGNHDWSLGLGDGKESRIQAVEIDKNDNLVLTGFTQGIRETSGLLQNVLKTSALLVAKIQTNKNILWKKEFLDANGNRSVGYAVTTLSDSSPVIVGNYFGDLTLGANSLTNTSGELRTLLTKLDPGGDPVWSDDYKGTFSSDNIDIQVDQNGAIILAGTFAGTINYGGGDLESEVISSTVNSTLVSIRPTIISVGGGGSAGGIGTSSTPLNSQDIFLVKFITDAGSGYQNDWQHKFGSGGYDKAGSIIIDNNNHILMTGAISSTVDFGGKTVDTSGGLDTFIAAFNENGNALWARSIKSTNLVLGNELVIDKNGDIILSGVSSLASRSATPRFTLLEQSFLAKIEWHERPLTVQQALDDLVENLESSDINYLLPLCQPSVQSVRTLLPSLQGKTELKIKDLFDALLCELDASNIPYDRNSTGNLVDSFVNTSGDTMTGPLTIDIDNNSITSPALSIDNANIAGNQDVLDFKFAGTTQARFRKEYSGDLFIGTVTNDDLNLLTNNAVRMKVNKNGNVGIGTGTTTPADKLQISGGGIRMDDSKPIFWGGNSVAIYGSQAGGYLKLKAASADAVTINSSGNVGIGMMPLSEKLEVNGTVKATAFIGDGSQLTGINSGKWLEASGGDIYYDLGRVGIGTTNLDYKLEVGSTSENNNYIRVQSKNTGGLLFYDGYGSNSGAISYYHGDDSLRFFTKKSGGNPYTRMSISSDGKVGIGLTPSTGKLEVNGDIRLGTDGLLYALAGLQNLRVITGWVGTTTNIKSGTGFNVKNETSPTPRKRVVTFDTNFISVPVVIVSCIAGSGNDQVATIHSIKTSGFKVVTRDVEEQKIVDNEFTFIVIGTR